MPWSRTVVPQWAESRSWSASEPLRRAGTTSSDTPGLELHPAYTAGSPPRSNPPRPARGTAMVPQLVPHRGGEA